MLPVSTPPNAIRLQLGHVPIGTMIRYGVGLSAVACLVIITAVSLLAPLLF